MVDIIASTTGANLASNVGNVVNWTTGIIVAILIIAIIIYYIYVRSFNILVTLKKPMGKEGGYILEMGYKAKFYWNTPQEMRFKIFNASKKKIQYFEEPPDRKFLIPVLVKGKVCRMIIMQPDSENIYHPVSLTQVNQNELVAELSNADITFVASEMSTQADKLLKKDFMQKYGTLVFFFLVLVIAVLYWWGAKQNADAANAIASAVQANTNALNQFVNSFGNHTTTGLIAH
jgi:cbb3-type cytochrome oxidase subunit 3